MVHHKVSNNSSNDNGNKDLNFSWNKLNILTVSSLKKLCLKIILISKFHFLVASLLSCLHQLKIENTRLEDHINSLVSRRDHLLAVNARLAIPLGQQQPQPAPSKNNINIFMSSHPNKQIISSFIVNNGPQQLEPQPTPQQQQPQQNTNKRSANVNPVTSIQIAPMENGIDYRGHNQLQSNSTQSSSSGSGGGSNIRYVNNFN